MSLPNLNYPPNGARHPRGRLPPTVNYDWEREVNIREQMTAAQYFREQNQMGDNASPISALEWNPLGLTHDALLRTRTITTPQAFQKIAGFRDSNLEVLSSRGFIQADISYDGYLKIFNINLNDLNIKGLPIVKAYLAEDGVEYDSGRYDVAAITAYICRRLKLTNYPTEAVVQHHGNMAHPYRFPIEDGEPLPSFHKGNVQNQNIRTFLNDPLTAQERIVPVKVAINLFAPLGSQYTRGGEFSHYVGGAGAVNFNIPGQPQVHPNNAPFGPPLGGMNQQDRLHPFAYPPFRHQYKTFHDFIAVERLNTNRDNHFYSSIFKNVQNFLTEKMQRLPESGQDPFTCGMIQIVCARQPAMGYDFINEVEVNVNGMRCIAAKSSQQDCFLACMKLVRTRYANVDLNNSFKRTEVKVFKAKDYSKIRQDKFEDFRTIREICNFPPGQMISIFDKNALTLAAKYFKISFTIYDENWNELVVVSNEHSYFEAAFIYFEEHCFLNIDQVKPLVKTTCSICSRSVNNIDAHKVKCIARREKALQKYTPEQLERKKERALLFHPFRMDQDYTWKDVDVDEHCIFFDFETLAIPNKKGRIQLQVYAAGWFYQNKYQDAYGADCMDVFLRFLNSVYHCGHYGREKEKFEEGKTAKPEPVKLIAWNGSGFDFYFILRYIMKRKYWRDQFEIRNPIQANNRILSAKIGPYIKCWDPMRFITTSLDDACEAFNISKENCKSIFPHLIIQSMEDINKMVTIDDLNNEAYYFPKSIPKLRKNKWSPESLEKDKIPMKGDFYCLKNVIKIYLKHDVMGMAEIVKVAHQTFGEYMEANIFSYMTLPQLSKTLWLHGLEKWKNQIYKPITEEENNAFRAAVYGGRVETIKNRYKSTKFDVIKFMDKYENKDVNNGFEFEKQNDLNYNDFEDDCVVEYDQTSLYVSVMCKFNFPIGKPRNIPAEDITIANDHADEFEIDGWEGKRKRIFERLSIWIIDYIANPWLIMAILPRREDDGGLTWSLEPGEGWYTSIEIGMAMKCHYKIVFKRGYYWTNDAPILKDFGEKTFKIKEEGGKKVNGKVYNPAMKQCGKLAGNSCYGSLLQKDIKKKTSLCYDMKDYRRFLGKADVQEVITFTKGIKCLTGAKHQVEHKSPVHLGCFILSYARLIMFSEFISLNPTIVDVGPTRMNTSLLRTAMKHTPYNTDTDSAHVDHNIRHRFKEVGKGLGQIKDESDDKGRCLFYLSPANKERIGIYIKKDNSLYCSITSKGIFPISLTMKHFQKRFMNEEEWEQVKHFWPEKDREWMNGASLLSLKNTLQHTGLNGGPFCEVTYKDLKKTFGLTKYGSRCRVRKNFEKDENDSIEDEHGEWSLPWGHALIKSTKYRYVAKKRGSPDHNFQLLLDQSKNIEEFQTMEEANIEFEEEDKDWFSSDEEGDISETDTEEGDVKEREESSDSEPDNDTEDEIEREYAEEEEEEDVRKNKKRKVLPTPREANAKQADLRMRKNEQNKENMRNKRNPVKKRKCAFIDDQCAVDD